MIAAILNSPEVIDLLGGGGDVLLKRRLPLDVENSRGARRPSGCDYVDSCGLFVWREPS